MLPRCSLIAFSHLALFVHGVSLYASWQVVRPYAAISYNTFKTGTLSLLLLLMLLYCLSVCLILLIV